MQKSFESVEDVIADEGFLSWIYKGSEEKIKAWENWMVDNPAYQDLVKDAIKQLTLLNLEEIPVSTLRIEEEYYKLDKKLGELDADMAPVTMMKPTRKRWWIGTAAAILLLLSGLWLLYTPSDSKPVIKTQYGHLRQQELPDGSQVMLNANTSVSLGKVWDKEKDREVWLNGEAFFHVKKTAHKNRFIVHTNHLDIIVTGTQFNVSTRGDRTSVLLTEGSVTIKTSDGKEIFMKPGDFIEMQNSSTEKKKISEEKVLAWKENKLNFDNIPLKDVVLIINDHYGVSIELADDSIGERLLTGMMPNNSLDDLLNALEATTDFKITRTDKNIIISTP